MTKAELVAIISKKNHVDEQIIFPIVESLMVTIKSSLARNENVSLSGFGNFIVKHRAEKTARNIKRNTTIIVPARNIPAFKPAKKFEDSIK